MDAELVSVIIPVHDIEDYLPRCLECIGAQSYRNLEIILVDDGSTDGSGRICDEFAARESRARVIHHPSNEGLWAARNTGQQAAGGDYLWFPDGDDYFHKDIVRVMLEAINKTCASGERYDMAIVEYKRTCQLNEDVSSAFEPAFEAKTIEEIFGTYAHPQKGFSGFSMWSKFFRKDLICGILNEPYKYAQDRDYSIRVLLRQPKVIVIQNGLYWWVERDSSAMQATDYRFVRYQSETRFIYKNLKSLNGDNKRYGRYLLESLYQCMATWLSADPGSESITSVRRECREVTRKTWFSFLTYRGTPSIWKRAGRLLRIRFNGLYNRFYAGVRNVQ